ncbi:MAG TPA: hypothetical protein VK893_12340 [Pyrinomonadaceae bacterium]|nr:hypothetical protein [Pyrinomonadaceae bacterium]
MTTPELRFNRKAVDPMECIRGANALIKGQYWLFVGMCAVGLLIGAAVPMGILMGPMMCGLYLAFFKRRRGEPIEFGVLFKGFDYFAQSVIATLLHAIPIVIVIVPAYILFYVFFILSVAVQGDEPNPAAMFGVMGVFLLFYVAVIIVILLVSIGFIFVYPLIVDRKLQALDAIKWSFRAVIGNFWRILLLYLLNALLSLGGMLLCYVGMFLVFPITYGALAVAYEQVFGLSGPGDVAPDLPPPPPAF